MNVKEIKAILQNLYPGVPIDTATHDELIDGTIFANDTSTVLTLCDAQSLNRRTLRSATATFRKACEQRGRGVIVLHIAGYDDDPRELWQVPELCAWLALFCLKAKLFLPADVEEATGIKGGNDWILACMAAHYGRLRDLGGGSFEILS